MTELDSFFARKDKRKCDSRPNSNRGSTKPPGIKYTTPIELYKKLLQDSSTVEDAIGEKKKPDEVIEDDVWKAFDSEEKKDYTGLKIQALVPESDEEADLANEDVKPNGPWKIADIPCEPPVDTPPGTYVNPVERKNAKPAEPKGAPDVKSTFAFPSLYQEKTGLRVNQSVWNRNPPEASPGRSTKYETSERSCPSTRDVGLQRHKTPGEKAKENLTTPTQQGAWKLEVSQSEPVKVGKYLPPGLRQKFGAA